MNKDILINMENDSQLMLESESKLINRPRMSKGKRYDSYFIYIPSDLMKDSQFPLKDGDRIKVKVDGVRLIIEKSQNTQ